MYYMIIVASLVLASGSSTPPFVMSFKKTFPTIQACKTALKPAVTELVQHVQAKLPANVKFNQVADCFTQAQRDAIAKKLGTPTPEPDPRPRPPTTDVPGSEKL